MSVAASLASVELPSKYIPNDTREFTIDIAKRDFCGDKKVKQPSCSGSSASKRIIGYYEGWSSTRACRGQYPEDLLNTAYTHLNYAFAFVDPESFKVAPMSDLDVSLYPRFTGLKTINPSLETWVCHDDVTCSPKHAEEDRFLSEAGR